MKLFFRYLVSKRRALCLWAAFALLMLAAFLLYRLPLAALLYPLAVCSLGGIAFLLFDFSRVRRRHEELSRFSPDTTDALPAPDTVTEADYQALIRALQQSGAEQTAETERCYRDRIDYYTVWAHQIKTPIASMKLALQNEDSDLSRRLSSDLFRTQQYVDMALAFLRLDAETGDYVFRECEVESLVRACVRKFAPEFIARRLALQLDLRTARLVTDEKWFSFIVEQLLSNALKYTREGEIRLYMPDEHTLCIADTGIGIMPEDLPRLFDKGYTGTNGRTDKSASGLGLYLCRRIADNLGLGLSICSKVGVGTTVTVDLSQKSIRFE